MSTPANDDIRLSRLTDWLAKLEAPKTLPATLRPASSDASFRRYFRVDIADGGTLIAMDAPPPQEDVRPFVHVAALFAGTGVTVPTILASDIEQGFLLLSDLGRGAGTTSSA